MPDPRFVGLAMWDVFRMTATKACLLCILVVGCTRPNPRSCLNGCPDPAYPFCDEDGSLEGHPGTCIAVSCTPGEFVTCHGMDALECNASGNDYDVKSCEHRCDPDLGGCVECISDSQCVDPTPHCDTSTHTCRACVVDGDCSSGVCDLSTQLCVPTEQIIHASPGGSSIAGCGSEAMPCSLTRALLSIDAIKKVIKMATGVYSGGTVTIAGRSVLLDGFGATILQSTNMPALSIGDGANVHVQGVALISPDTGILCTTSGNAPPTFALTGVSIDGLSSPTGYGIVAKPCSGTIDGSHIRASNFALESWLNGAEVTIRRSTLEGAGFGVLDNGKVHITNTVVLNASATITQFNGGASDVSFSTIINSPVQCSTGEPETVTFSNNIIYSATTGDVVSSSSGCSHHYELLSPQSADPPVSDHIIRNRNPGFVDANGDFHLGPGSPAIDAADLAASEATDFDGISRPQGAGRDLGAFERKP